jgi:hypothetical protein
MAKADEERSVPLLQRGNQHRSNALKQRAGAERKAWIVASGNVPHLVKFDEFAATAKRFDGCRNHTCDIE